MNDPFSDSRGQARARAAELLAERGFIEQSDGSFAGELASGDQRVDIIVRLPAKFPDTPPTILLKDAGAVSRRSHIEPRGKLCLFPHTGVLVDATRPEQVIVDSLQRASSVLFEAESDYRTEFLAYWRQPYEPQILSIVTAEECSRPVAATDTAHNFRVVGDSPDHLEEWLKRVGWEATQSRNAFMIALRELPDAPSFEVISDLGDLFAIVKRHGENDDVAEFEAWLKANGLPSLLMLSAPGIAGTGPVVFAAELRRAEGQAAIRVHKGFRAGKMPPAIEVARSRDQPVTRIEPRRADYEFLIARVGGDLDLKTCSVVVIGCGSLGSQIAVNLAASGVGKLTLVDHEILSTDNIHRHALGMSSVGRYKADALRDHLLSRFPHLAVDALSQDIEKVCAHQQHMLLNHTLVVVATGEEALELRLNTFFRDSVKRIHAWLEPLGVGGHVLLTGATMCYSCLFDRDERGLHNLASLVRRGQDFLVAIDGCTSTFTPFGFVDAAQGAIEVARLALEVLQDEKAPPRLVSWLGSPHQFQAAGYELSSRGEQTLAKGRVVEHACGRRECEVCHG